jgi:hypothetical protein
VRFYVARQARRHKIGKAHLLAALAAAGDPVLGQDGLLHWIARDDRGLELHIAGRPSREDPDDLTVIVHCMPTDLERGQKWLT